MEVINDEQIYDVWKHKVHGKTLSEFSQEIKRKPQEEKPDVEKILKESFAILDEFTPREVS